MQITRLQELDPRTLSGLSEMLIAVVADGASIGFLPPVSAPEADAFWAKVPGPGVCLWVAEEDGRVEGTVQLHLCQKPSGRHRAEVAKLMVHPRAQQRGIGRKLMEVLEAEARRLGLTLLVLDTREGDPANDLYRSLGFLEAGRVPFWARSATGALETTVVYYKVLR